MKSIYLLFSLVLLSVALHAQIQTINVGTSAGDKTGDPLRTSFQKVNANDAYLETSKVPTSRTINSQPLSSDITLTKSNIGLSNVDNTSDVNKPVSTAQQTALDGKQATLVSGTNIKTVNGNSLLGSGDLTISGGGGSGDDYARDIVTKTGNHTLVISDSNKLIRMNVAIANTVTIPPNSSVAFPVRTQIYVMWYGSGQTSIVEGSGVTVRQESGTLALPTQYAIAVLVKVGTNEWVLNNGTPAYESPLTLTPNSVGFSISGGTTSKTLNVPLDATVSGVNTGDQTLTGLPYWNVTGNTTLTGASTIVQTTSNFSKFQLNSLGTTLTGLPGVWLSNDTDAAAGAQQISPIFLLRSRGWKTNATAASQTVDGFQYILPVQGTTAPTGLWKFSFTTNFGAEYNLMQLNSAGQVRINGIGTTNATAPLNVVNSASNSILTAWDDGQVTTNGTLHMFPQNTDGLTTSGLAGRSWHFFNSNASITNQSAFVFQAATQGPTANPYTGIMLLNGFSPSSGTATFSAFRYSGNINQTSTASGNIAGFEYTPTVTSALGLNRAFYNTSGFTQWDAAISPAQITSNQNDYNPTGLNSASILRVNTDASRNITSIVGGVNGRMLLIMNVGAQPVVLTADDGSSGTAANRFVTSITIAAGDATMVTYDGTSSRWRILR